MKVRAISLAAIFLAAACSGGEGITAFGGSGPTGPTGGTGGTGTGNRLVFTAQPATPVAAGAAFSVQVAVQNATGGTVATPTNSVTMSLTSGTGTNGAILGGTRTVSTVNGVAAFSNLSIDRAGSGFTLTATANGVTGATSGPITVNP